MEEAKELSRAGAKKGAAAELKFQAAETAHLQGRCGALGGLRSGTGPAAGQALLRSHQPAQAHTRHLGLTPRWLCAPCRLPTRLVPAAACR